MDGNKIVKLPQIESRKKSLESAVAVNDEYRKIAKIHASTFKQAQGIHKKKPNLQQQHYNSMASGSVAHQ